MINQQPTRTYSGTADQGGSYHDGSGFPQSIEIGFWESVLGIVVILVGAGIAWGKMHSSICGIKESLDRKIEPELKDVRERFIVVEDRVGSMWKDRLAPSSSPRQLNERGKDILAASGIREVIDGNKDKLFELIRKRNPTNAYDAEKEITETVMDIRKYCPKEIDKLKDGAFRVGSDIDAVLFVGGIYLRDLIFKDLGFSLDELDGKK